VQSERRPSRLGRPSKPPCRNKLTADAIDKTDKSDAGACRAAIVLELEALRLHETPKLLDGALLSGA